MMTDDSAPESTPKPEPPPVNRGQQTAAQPQQPHPLGGLGRYASLFSALPPVPATGQGELPENEEKMWSMFAHIGAIIGLGFLAPLVIYLIQNERSPFVVGHAKESLNFQLSMMIYIGVCAVASVILIFPMLFVIAFSILMIVVGIIAGIKAYEGSFFPLPFTIRFVR